MNGEINEYHMAPALDAKQKHTIEVIVDRLKVKPEISQRLADSIETAVELSEGLVLIETMGAEAETQLFSTKHACTKCGYSVAKLRTAHLFI